MGHTRSNASLEPTFDGSRIRFADIGGALAITDLDARLCAVTPAAKVLLARLGVPCDDLPRPLPPRLRDQLNETPLGEALEWAPDGQAAGGRLGCSRYPLGTRHHLLMMREISEKHRALSERLHSQRLEATGRLVASVVHELRAPLGSIFLNTGALQRALYGAPSDVRVGLADIEQATHRMRRTIEGLLDFARLGPPVRDLVSVRDALGGASQTLRAAFRDGGHELRTNIAHEASRVVANQFVLEQILVNLFQNAIESSSEPVVVMVSARRVSAAGGRDVAHISVSDTGPGVPESVRQRIFDPFFTTKSRGTGLGLATARDAARSLEGDLRLEGAGKRSQFVVEVVAADLALLQVPA